MSVDIFQCAECGGVVIPLAAPGRIHTYRGDGYAIPSDFIIPTCTCCGSEWMDEISMLALEAAFKRQVPRIDFNADADAFVRDLHDVAMW